MFKNYLKIGLRNLLKKPGYSFINVFGLSVGLASFLLIGLFIQHELSYDAFHENYEDIYRVGKKGFTAEFLGSDEWVSTSAPLSSALVNEIPDIKAATNITKVTSFFKKDNQGVEESGIFAAGDFFDVFSFKLIQGDTGNGIEDPNGIFLSESLAQKYFGNTNAVGQAFSVIHSGGHFSGELTMVVKGVFSDVPANSHLSFDYIVPVTSSHELSNYLESWRSNSYLTYILTASNTPSSDLVSNINAVTEKYEQEHADQSENRKGAYFIQPLKGIHLYSKVNGEFQANGNILYVYLFSAIALIIIALACINYTNLSVARSFLRAKEVGVRKSIGASKQQLSTQFLTESLLITSAAVIIALALVQVFLPYFGSLVNRDISMTFSHAPYILLLILGVGVLVSLMAGVYPAFVLSRFNPIKALKGHSVSKSGKPMLQKVLVSAQFTATIALIIGALVIYKQLNFISSTTTGLEREQIVSISIKDRDLYQKYEILKDALEKKSSIQVVSAAQIDPINIQASSIATGWEGMEPEGRVTVYRSAIQHDFISLFGLEIIEGRDFSKDMATDEQTGIIINEAMKRKLGWDTATDKSFTFRGREGRITGVVKDFNFHSYHQAIEPLALFLETDWWFPYQKIFVKIDASDVPTTLAYIEETVATFSPGYPFEFIFLDDAFQTMYQTENRFARLLNYFTMLALLIACLGLLGLATFTISQRTKEIGIRKVLGATTSTILLLLSKDFLKPVLIGFFIATPIAWYTTQQWLTQFAYKIDLTLWLFILSGTLTAIIAFLAIGWQAFSIARMNPVNSLKNE
ncbi:MAG: ABC transporter permease [Balneola sp.]|nr:MAG: ABC transporter permease [Balneola sp.]